MRRRGFTLVETLVALAATTVVLAALAGAVRTAAAARTRALDAADRAATARTLLLRLAAEIEAARPPAPDGLERFVVETPEDAPARLRLATAAPVASGPGDVHVVSYAVEPDASDGVLVRREALPGAPDPPGQPVLERVRAFRVRCLAGGVWQPACAPDRLPRAVELTIAVDDGRGGEETLVIAATPAAAE